MSAWWSGHRIVDPSDIERRYSTEDGYSFMEGIGTEEVSEESATKMERVREVLGRIPPREADFIDLYFFRQVRQTDIAAIFRVSQPTVCYRLRRATERINFLLNVPERTDEQLMDSVAPYVSDPVDRRILARMYQTTCQSAVAKELGVTQGFVRHRYLRSLGKIKAAPELSDLVEVFDLISSNLNMLHEVQRHTSNELIYAIM